jgi:hypothetical protein
MLALIGATYIVWWVGVYGRFLLEKEALFISAEFDIVSNTYAEKSEVRTCKRT